MPRHVLDLLLQGLRAEGQRLEGAAVAVLGLSYKPEIGDTRLSPSLTLCDLLRDAGAVIQTVDPFVPADQAENFFHSSSHHPSIQGLSKGLDAVVLMVGHKDYLPLPLDLLAKVAARKPILVDAPRLVTPTDARAAGFRYLGVGAGKHNPPRRGTP